MRTKNNNRKTKKNVVNKNFYRRCTVFYLFCSAHVRFDAKHINKNNTWLISSKKKKSESLLYSFSVVVRYNFDTSLLHCINVAVTVVVLNTTSCLFQSCYINTVYAFGLFHGFHTFNYTLCIHIAHTWLRFVVYVSVFFSFFFLFFYIYIYYYYCRLVLVTNAWTMSKYINTLSFWISVELFFFIRSVLFYIIIHMDLR